MEGLVARVPPDLFEATFQPHSLLSLGPLPDPVQAAYITLMKTSPSTMTSSRLRAAA